MNNKQLQQNILASQKLVSNIKEIPEILAIQVEVIPDNQSLDSFFSDSIHMVAMTKGHLMVSDAEVVGQKVAAYLNKHFAWKDAASVMSWLRGLNRETPLISFNSADVLVCAVKWSSLRTQLPSQLENDLKYRFGVQEFYMDGVNIVRKFCWNKESARYSRARETLLRMNYVPVRLVKRLVK